MLVANGPEKLNVYTAPQLGGIFCAVVSGKGSAKAPGKIPLRLYASSAPLPGTPLLPQSLINLNRAHKQNNEQDQAQQPVNPAYTLFYNGQHDNSHEENRRYFVPQP